MSQLRPYLIAVLAVAAGLLARLALNALVAPSALPFIFFFPAVAVAAWYGGWRPGAVAIILSALAANWFFMEPTHGFTAKSTYDLVAVLAFAGACAFIVGSAEAMHASRRRLRAETDERLRVAASLAESQERLAAIVRYAGDAIVTKSPQGIVQSWNAAAEALFGYRAEEMIGRPITVLIPADRLHEETEILERLRQGKPSERLETIRLTKDGRPRHVSVSVSPIRDVAGQIIGASKIVHDITDTVTARDALIKERELLATTLASIGDAVIVTDTAGRVATLNHRAQALTGWSQDQAAGKDLATVFHIVNEHTRETVENPVHKALRSGAVVGLANHTVLIDRNGIEWPIDDSAAPIRQSDGSILGVVLVFRDIAERRRTEAALRAADRRKDEFLAVLSHELRNPLAPISMAVAMLRHHESLDPQAQELRDVIDRQTRQLSRLLDDLLDISRIASGKIAPRIDRMSLLLAVRSAIETARPHLDAAGQTLALHAPDEPIELDGDLGRLAQVFSNLLNNASKYSERGSEIRVVVERRGDAAVVRVIDAGRGIPGHELPRIFEMFAQVGPPDGRGRGGLGVGLWLAKTFVELHHGQIQVRSEGAGHGSEFIVTLPLPGSTREARRESPQAPAVEALPPKRVLVTDDNVDAAYMLAETLRLAGHDIRTANDGEAALQIAHEFQPDVAIVDIGMPLVDGYEVARRLRGEFGRNITLLALTGWGQDADRKRAADAGFDRHLTKPVDVPELFRALAKP
ncbi:MAG TPA: PAS domain S-box protein [Vicinamibacterales bacterium]|nr:PAS domain S-box protein [Vicinamibacterales bacterium]